MAAFLSSSDPFLFNSPEKKEKEKEDESAYQKAYAEYIDLVPTLPKQRGWMTEHLLQYRNTWLTPTSALKGVVFLQHLFKPQPSDIFLASFPKSGTTWLRAIIFAIMNRSSYEFSSHPLLTTGPHSCFPFLDAFIYQDDSISPLQNLPSPRLFSTHIPCALLPESLTRSGCRFVYICRDPKDVLVSKWIFLNRSRSKHLPPLSLEEAFELFCRGVSHYGPFWDHVLGYWKASLEWPNKVLFLKYEDLKRDPLAYVKRLGEFLGQPFSAKEERNGFVDEIVRLCSFENLSNLEVNKKGEQKFNNQLVFYNSDFFRKGQVGDWKNYLTEDMGKHIDQITEKMLYGSGLKFGT